jgi:enoyl-CoA hydratase/carnithine racemase
MATNAERAAVLVRALEAAIVDDTAAIPELSTEDVEGWAPALSVASADDVVIDPTGLRVSLHGVVPAVLGPGRAAGPAPAGAMGVTGAMPDGPLRWEVAAGVAHVVIDHPPSNLVDGAFVGGLSGLLDELERDDGVRVVVFTSADPDFFLMHGDVRGILAIPPGEHVPATEPNLAAALFERWHRSPLVSMGVVDGIARGGGAEFLAALDLRYGSERAVLGQPEVAMGILPGAGGTARLPHLLGRGRALEVILTGRDLGAEAAARVGWLDAVYPRHQLDDAVHELAHRIAAMPPASVAAVKRVVDRTLDSFADGLVAESDTFGALTAGGLHRSRMQRFLDAGGQTREGETTRWAELLDAMDD